MQDTVSARYVFVCLLARDGGASHEPLCFVLFTHAQDTCMCEQITKEYVYIDVNKYVHTYACLYLHICMYAGMCMYIYIICTCVRTLHYGMCSWVYAYMCVYDIISM